MPKYHLWLEADIELDEETVATYEDKGANMLFNFQADFDSDPDEFLNLAVDSMVIKTVQTTHP